MPKLILPFLETMVTQACNLSCLGCTNYSDLPHKGYVKWSDAKQNLKEWLTRIEIDDFGILGGEPLMNPEIEKWIIGLRELMPNAQIRFTTNGLLLDKKFHIVKLLHDTGNCVLKITNHFYQNDKIENWWWAIGPPLITNGGVSQPRPCEEHKLKLFKPFTIHGLYKSV